MQLNPITTNFIVRPTLSLAVGIILPSILYLIDALLETEVLPFYASAILSGLIAVLVALNEDEPTNVPVAYAALVTFFGMRTSIVLTEGDYTWTGKRLFFNRFKGVVPGMDALAGSKDGFIFIGEFPMPIWNQAADKDKTTLSNVARDSSTVQTNLTIVIRIVNLRKWVGSSDPVLDIAERARAAFRTAISFFTGVDCAAVKTLLGKLMIGTAIVTSFIRKQVDSSPQWSMIQDTSGGHMFKEVIPQNDETREVAIDRSKREFAQDLSRADPKMRETITNSEGHAKVESRSIDHHLVEVIEDVGAELVRVSIGDFTLSPEVETQANKAAGEAFQREGQIRSAQTIRDAKEILAPKDGLSKPGDELATILAAAHDNPKAVNVVYVPGGDQLTRAAVAGAKQIGDKK